MKAETIRQMEKALQDAMMNLQPDKIVSARSMFGGAGFFVDGQMIAAWFGAGLALKLPEDARLELRHIEGAKQTQSAQYVEVPNTFLENPDLLVPWLAKSLEYVRSQPVKKRQGSG
jgi:TfoX/Sxy family transcriptional regulator of competence genes